VDGVDARHAAADLVLAAHQRARALGRDQDHVQVLARGDHAEVDVEAVGEQQAGAGLHVRADRLLVDLLLDHVRGQDRDQVGVLHRLGRRLDHEAVGLGLGLGRAARAQADDHVEAGVAQVQRMRAALAAIADDRDALDEGGSGGTGHGGVLCVAGSGREERSTKNPAPCGAGFCESGVVFLLTRRFVPHPWAR